MDPSLWHAKKIVDSTLHPDTGEPVLLPFRMSSFVLSNLIVTAGMLTPNLSTRGTVAWQFANQSLNVAINASNANKSSPLSWRDLGLSYALAVSASCGVAVGLGRGVARLNVGEGTRVVLGRLVPFAAVVGAGVLNVFLMRGGELVGGIDVFPASSPSSTSEAPSPSSTVSNNAEKSDASQQSLGKSKRAAFIAIAETAASRVINAAPVMAIPPLILVALQRRSTWLQARPQVVLPVNLGLIFGTSVFALPLALAVFPTREEMDVGTLEESVRERMGKGKVWFNRGI